MIIFEESKYRLKGKDAYVTKRHSHNAIEFIECVSGSGTVLIDNHVYPLKEHYLYVIDARRPHNVNPESCETYTRNKIVVEADSFLSFCRETGILTQVEGLFYLPPIQTQLLPEINQIFKTVAQLCESADTEELGFAQGYVLQLIHIFKKQSKAELSASNPFIERALEIISECGGVTSLEKISKQLHLNKYYICHLFKSKTGMTVTEYLAEKRYERAVRLLRDTESSIEEISADCGFATASSFTRFFKQKSSISPREYRKAHRT